MKKIKFNNRPNKEYKIFNDENLFGKTIYDSRSPAVNAIVFAKSKGSIYVLIEKRSQTMRDCPGLWAVPSGYMDWDESGFKAVLRELYEETSLDIQKYSKYLISYDNNPFYVNTDPSTNRQNIELNYCLIFDFENTKLPDIEKYKDKEIEVIKWFCIDEIIKNPDKSVSFFNNYEWAFNHDEMIRKAFFQVTIF